MSRLAGVGVVGPLAPYARGFAAELARQGWTAGSGAHQLGLVAHLSRWLDEQELDAAALTSPRVVERFAALRRTAGYSVYCSPTALAPLLGYLRGLGVIDEAEPAAVSPVEALLGRYADYLVHRRGLAASSVGVYVGAVRGFVAGLVVDGRVELEGLSAAQVTAFMLAACTPRQPGKAKTTATALRSLLGFLHAEGLTASALAGAVPQVASWQQAALPRDLEPTEVRRLLASCDRRTSLGRRDYGILLLLARLGLRAGEVARLELDDIDWRAGELVLRGKGGRAERLPLPADVGAALVAYLRRGRPATALDRRVFIRLKAPHRGMSSEAVSERVWAAGRRAGIEGVRAHRLRHAAASGLLAAGAALPEVGQLLRHRKISTTAIYAKVDRNALAALAPAWPGVAS